MQDIRFLETHADVFFAGMNLGKKHTTENMKRKYPGMSFQWDDDKQRAVVMHNGRKGIVLTNNCAFVEIEDGATIELPKNEHKTSDVAKRTGAQVSTPMGHVFEGPGVGKTGSKK